MNKTMRKLLSITLAFIMLFGSVPMANLGIENLFAVEAEAAPIGLVGDENNITDGDYVYQKKKYYGEPYEDEPVALIIKYIGRDEVINVPETLGGMPVIGIYDYAFSPVTREPTSMGSYFYHNPFAVNAKTINLPETVVKIYEHAFDGCVNLENINMPNDLAVVEDYAFKDTAIKKLDFGGAINVIYRYAFTDSIVEDVVISEHGCQPWHEFPACMLEIDGLTGAKIKNLTIKADSYNVDVAGCYTLENVVFESGVEKFAFAKEPNGPNNVVFKSYFSESLYNTFLDNGYNYKRDDTNGVTNFYIAPKGNENGFEYFVNADDKAIITKYTGTEKTVFIPASLGGYPVFEIASRAFYKNDSIEAVACSVTVENIQSEAFAYCKNLKRMIFGANVKEVGNGAFRECPKLYEAFFHPAVEKIGEYAFYKCFDLQEIYLTESCKSIGEYAFYACDALESFTAPGIDNIPAYMLYSCNNLTEVNFSDDLSSVGEQAFAWCEKLESIGVSGEKITSFGKNAFGDSGLKSFVFSPELTVIPYGVLAGTNITEITIPEKVTEIDMWAFSGCKKLETVNFLGELEKIGSQAFENCISLDEDFKIPDSVVYIGNRAFSGCITLTGTLTIQENVEYIGDCAFEETGYTTLLFNAIECGGDWCFSYSNIENVVLGDKVKLITSECFRRAYSLKSVKMSNSITKIESAAFWECTSLEEITIPKGVTEMTCNTFYWCKNLKTVYYNAENCTFEPSITVSGDKILSEIYSPFYIERFGIEKLIVGDGVKVIPEYFFSKLNLTQESFVLPDSVTEIKKHAFFESCVEEIKLPDNLVSIEEKAFYNTNVKIEYNVLPSKLRMIGKSAFENCDYLTELYIPDSVLDIDESAFYDCDSLVKVRMSPNVKLIPESAFRSCDSLATFEWNSDVKLIGEYAFADDALLTDFDFTGVEKIYPNSFTGSGVNLVMLGENKKEEATELEVVEVSSFENCANLETLSIGGNVATIKSAAFANCEKLETAVISPTVTNIAVDAFDGCDALTIYCVEESYAHEYALNNGIPVSTFVIDAIPNQVYTGKEIEPDVNVKVSDKKLTENTDFAVKYSDNINVGTAKVLVSGKGIYKVLASVANFTIITKNVENITVSPVVNQIYDGSELKPEITVTNGDKILTEGVDYTVTYKNNTEAGTATAEITGIGNYSGKTTVTFEIVEQTFWQKVASFFEMIINAIVNFFRSIFK